MLKKDIEAAANRLSETKSLLKETIEKQEQLNPLKTSLGQERSKVISEIKNAGKTAGTLEEVEVIVSNGRKRLADIDNEISLIKQKECFLRNEDGRLRIRINEEDMALNRLRGKVIDDLEQNIIKNKPFMALLNELQAAYWAHAAANKTTLRDEYGWIYSICDALPDDEKIDERMREIFCVN